MDFKEMLWFFSDHKKSDSKKKHKYFEGILFWTQNLNLFSFHCYIRWHWIYDSILSILSFRPRPVDISVIKSEIELKAVIKFITPQAWNENMKFLFTIWSKYAYITNPYYFYLFRRRFYVLFLVHTSFTLWDMH